MPLTRSLLLALFLILASVATARGATLGISPLRLDLGEGATGTLTLTNKGRAPALVQIETFAWTGSSAPEDLDPTRDILALPAVVSIAPQGRQIIRVAARQRPTADREHAYRLIVTEVPPPRPAAMGVQIAVRFSLPVFLGPRSARPSPRWHVEHQAGALKARLVNNGNAHLHIRRLTMIDGQGEPLPLQIANPRYLLPGEEHVFPLAPGGTELPSGSRLKAETNIGALELELPDP